MGLRNASCKISFTILKAPFSAGDHGFCESTTRFGRGSETALLGLYGPGIKGGFTLKLYLGER